MIVLFDDRSSFFGPSKGAVLLISPLLPKFNPIVMAD